MEDHDYRCDRLTQLADWIREAAENIAMLHYPTDDECSPRHYSRHPHVELTHQRADEIVRYTRAMYVLIDGLRSEQTTHSLGVDEGEAPDNHER